MTIWPMALLWLSGGAIFAHGALTNAHASPGVAAGSGELLEALRRPEPAALVALFLFVALWPAIFVGAHFAPGFKTR